MNSRVLERRWVAVIAAALGTGFVPLAGSSPVASAAIFTVSSTADAIDVSPGDGLCQTSAGVCSLRAAIMETNALGGSTIHTLLVPGGTYTLSIKGSGEDAARTGDLDIKSNLEIRPNGVVTVQGGNGWDDRIVDVFPPPVSASTAIRLTGMVIQGGNADTGGGIRNAANLALSSCTVTNNTASRGGGIFNSLRLQLGLSTVAGNHAANEGGGIFNQLGGDVFMSDTTVSGNTSSMGGGIFTNAGHVNVDHSTISGNTVDARGGNSAADGGGIWSAAALVLTNSTISGNQATGNGGGILTTGRVDAVNTTIATNVADSDDNRSGDGGGTFTAPPGIVVAVNTIIGANIDRSAVLGSPDCAGVISSNGYNLIQSTAGCEISGTTTGNITGRSPQLGPLQNNGGFTLTHALLVSSVGTFSSPAIDAGNPGGTPGTACLSSDQRHKSRPLDGNSDGIFRCDIGAFEASPPTFIRGSFTLEPGETVATVGEHVSYEFAWTVPEPGWRVLDTLQLRMRDEQGVILWVRFQEVTGAPGTFSLVNPDNGKVGPAFAPGMPNRLETEAATLYLAGSAVDGPPGSRVGLTLEVSFKPQAAGRTYQIEVLATDDAGQEQGFEPGGFLTVR